jgi:prepilin-type N-terminal cleavage/methylation domain-containing protein
MSTSVRARRGAHGFSFIELLVTIVIAGIALAALVPVFVSAQMKGAGDTARNVALNLAQDRVEKVRRLDYDLITESNLTSLTFQGGHFGTVAHVEGGKGTKDYNLVYSVLFVGGTKDGAHAVNYTSGDGTENYKMVTVDAYWTGNPRPVKHAVLKTYIYKQYAGSYIDALAATPVAGNIDPADATRQFVTSYSITLTAYLNEADAQNTAEVTFWVYSSTGQELAQLHRKTAEVTTAGVYAQTYTIAGLAGSQDGVYTFKAKAVSKYGYPGNTAVAIYPVETGAPPVPTGLAGLPGNVMASLSWSQSPASDVVSYEIYRDKNPGLANKTLVKTIAFDAQQAPSYIDQGLTNLQTYYYTVVAVDSVGRRSGNSDEVAVTPQIQTDTPPNPPTNALAVASLTAWPPQIDLQWSASTTILPLPTPNSAIDHYNIYRSDDNGATYAAWPTPKVVTHLAGQPTFSYGDNAGLAASKMYSYRIAAVNKAGQSSPYVVVGATTRTTIKYNLRVENLNTKTSADVKVTDLAGKLIDVAAANPSNPLNPTIVANKKNNTTWWVIWNLPPGSYLTWWKLTSGGTWSPSKDGSLTSADRVISFGP